jgi:hypothetical protein
MCVEKRHTGRETCEAHNARRIRAASPYSITVLVKKKWDR